MIKYRYLPFTHNKPRYQGLSETKWQLKAQSSPLLSVSDLDVTNIDQTTTITTATSEKTNPPQILVTV